MHWSAESPAVAEKEEERMKSFVFRVKRRMAMLVSHFRSDCHFSLYYAMLRIADELGGRLRFRRLSKVAHAKKDQWILSYLHKTLEPTIHRYQNCTAMGEPEENAAIWVCWWTGEETAPALVRKCIESIRANAGTHPVNLIDRNTYSSYLDLPEDMVKNVGNGTMGLAHLADYIRVALLEKYGGLWLDATIFCAKKIPQAYFEYPFFTCKSNPTACGYLSQMRWTTFVLGGWKGNVFYRFLKEALEAYWSQERVAIDYLFFDYLIELARREVPAILAQMEQVPVNNLNRDDLQAAMNLAKPASSWEQVLAKDTVLYKLSWRECYRTKTDHGEDSIYQFFLEQSP